MKARWALLIARYGEDRIHQTLYLLLIGVASLVIRALMHYEFHYSALLYVGVPYAISMLLVWFRSHEPTTSVAADYGRHLTIAMMIFLASSIILFEGFVCVVMFIPIYVMFVSLAYAIGAWAKSAEEKRDRKLRGTVLPLLIFATALEGTTPSLSLERFESVSATTVTAISAEDVHRNLVKPMELRRSRGWLISVFPMPVEIIAGSLQVGDVHRIHTRYHRWFVTNTHEGEMALEITEVSPHRIRTRFISDTSFFASYVTPIATQIDLQPTASGGTEVTLTIHYERKLDPAWYFGPLQRTAMRQMADFLIDEVMIREHLL
ncbi:MAG: hypothetical protein AAF004_06190 [Pseudomonadota bacterium]